ncbi:hypothetical protein GCM10009834_37170 [Streptomonospora arabica]
MDGFVAGAPVAVDMVEVLRRSGVFLPEGLDVQWNQDDVGSLGVDSRMTGVSGLTADSLVDRVLRARPQAYPLAEPTTLEILGTGRWIAADGTEKEEPGLLAVSVDVVHEDTVVELGVHHDIWMENSFSGVPHPQIHALNAPRLREVLQSVEEQLGVETEPDGATALGTSFNYGVRAHRRPDGGPFDATRWL